VSDEYSQYTVIDDIKINGKLTLGEDVADLGGTLLAYMAWKARPRAETAAHRRLHARPALLHRHGAVGLRRRAAGEQARNAITNPHSPDEYRINGVVSNMPEFPEGVLMQAGPADGAPTPAASGELRHARARQGAVPASTSLMGDLW
jgi:putative endopeptidase